MSQQERDLAAALERHEATAPEIVAGHVTDDEHRLIDHLDALAMVRECLREMEG